MFILEFLFFSLDVDSNNNCKVRAYPSFCSMKWLGLFLTPPPPPPPPLDGMLVDHRVTPSIKFAGTHLYTWVDRGTRIVKCLAQEHI